MSEQAPCPVCGVELVYEEGSRGVCPKCGERTEHVDGEIVVDEEIGKGVKKYTIPVTVTVTSYSDNQQWAVERAIDRVDTLLQCGRYQSPYSDDEYSIEVDGDSDE